MLVSTVAYSASLAFAGRWCGDSLRPPSKVVRPELQALPVRAVLRIAVDLPSSRSARLGDLWSQVVAARLPSSNMSIDTDVLSAGFARLLSAGHLRR